MMRRTNKVVSERRDSMHETIAPRISEFSAHHPGDLFGLHGLEGIFVVEQLHRRRCHRSLEAAGQDHRTAAGRVAAVGQLAVHCRRLPRDGARVRDSEHARDCGSQPQSGLHFASGYHAEFGPDCGVRWPLHRSGDRPHLSDFARFAAES